MPYITANDRHRRIIQLAQDWNISLPAVPNNVFHTQPRPSSYRKPGDDQVADDLLRKRASDTAQNRPKSISRAFSISNLKKGKSWDPRDVADALRAWIAQDGSPGVAEALIAKLEAAGVDVGAGQVQKSGVLSRRRSLGASFDRTELLRLAVERNQLEMTQVLLPYADALSLDICLPVAVDNGNLQIVDILLRAGASAARTDNGHAAFRRACAIPDQSDLVSLIVRSDGRPNPTCISQSMIDAAALGNLENVLYLSRSIGGDGNYEQARALKAAISIDRRDIALAIAMGNSPPQRPGLDEAFRLAFHHTKLSPKARLEFAELLLCCGAAGTPVSEALQQSCESGDAIMAKMLVGYGASIEYNGASALKVAISRSRPDLVNMLLDGNAVLEASLASQCISHIPKQANSDYRHVILSMLLPRGAHGEPLSQCLIDATHAGDVASVDLLVKPLHALGGRRGSSQGWSKASEFRKAKRHEVASADFNDGQALKAAVTQGNLAMTQKILTAQPSSRTLSFVFPLTKNLPPTERYEMVELFLKGALTGPCLHGALQDALDENVSRRDNRLIDLLLQYGADINFDSGRGLQAIIGQGDIQTVDALMQNASPETAAARITDVTAVQDHKARYQMMSLLMRAGAATGRKQVSAALLESLKEQPVDIKMLKLLIENGGADVTNEIIDQAVACPDASILELILSSPKLPKDAVSHCFAVLAPLPSVESKATKLKALLAKSALKEDLSDFLVKETQVLLRGEDVQKSFSTLQILLQHGADPNTVKGSALCQAVAKASEHIVDMLLKSRKRPTSTTLGNALPHALRLQDPTDRLIITQKLMDAGASKAEANRALMHALGAYTEDIPLLTCLANAADTTDGEALQLAVSKASPILVDLLLSKSTHDSSTRDMALMKAMSIGNRESRYDICSRLIAAGISAQTASDALLVAAREDDSELCDALLSHGASLSNNDGRAIIEACRGGSVGILGVLLKSGVEVPGRTLEQGFQAATEVRDLNRRAEVFEKLLARGIRGEVVDAQLQSAARYGEAGEAVLRALLAAGADPNYNNGEAVAAATRSAFIGSLELLLALWDDKSRQIKPSGATLSRAFKECWGLSRDSRFHIIKGLFKAGLPVTDDLHVALNNAVNEEDPEERLVKLLLDHGASPAANEHKTLLDATRSVASASLKLLLDQSNIPCESLNQAFMSGFDPSNFSKWFSEAGIQSAKMLLERGTRGTAITTALAVIVKDSPPESAALANRFVNLLASYDPDIEYDNGVLLKWAAARANVAWTRKFLDCHPSSQALYSGLQGVLESSLPQDEALALCRLFTQHHKGECEGDTAPDKLALNGEDAIAVQAIKQYPRSKDIIETILDAGYWYDQVISYTLHPDVGPEEATLLTWAIAQPQKRVSTSVLQVLLDKGAKVNIQTPLSATTPLMLAVQNRRPDVVEALLIDGAEVDVEDSMGRTPLSLATQIGGDIAVQMMRLLLAANPSKDDGSLHNAARELNLPAVQALVQVGHDPDFPSPLHDGRSALAELCLHASDAHFGPVTPEREKAMQKVMAFLIEAGSDLTIKSHGKSILHLCFQGLDPVTTTRLLLKVGMWKHVNKPFNLFVDDRFTYSPTMYLIRYLPPSDSKEPLLTLLRANRAIDAFYATSGNQPDGAVGLPEDLAVQERERQARQSRLVEDSQEFAVALNRKRELANVDKQIHTQRVQMEDARRQKLHEQDLGFARSRAQLDDSLSQAATQRKLSEQRALAATERDTDDLRQRKALEWESAAHRERVDNARALGAVRVSEREEVDRLERKADERMQKRMEAQRKLIEGQERLARTWAEGGGSSGAIGGGRRPPQIGYVTEER